jgi:hypothetical protein
MAPAETVKRRSPMIFAEYLCASFSSISISSTGGKDESGRNDRSAHEENAPSGRQVIRISIDHFPNPRSARYARSRYSPEKYY